MPGPLDNARHERFAQELAKGASQVEAYERAGYKPNDSHAARLVGKGRISDRIAELKAAAATEAVTTIHDIARQLDEDRKFARDLEAPSAAISATMGKAKVLGLLTEKVEHTGKDGGPIETTDTDLARLIVFQLTKASRDPS